MFALWTNARIQSVRAVDSTQVRTADRALGCNSLFVDYSIVGCFEYNVVVFDSPSYLEVVRVNQQVGIPGIVRNGVVVPQSNQPLPEGTHVEIRVEPGDVPAVLMSEIEAWDKASDESWKWIDSLEANEE
jgi:hypothetical protein